MGIFEDAVEKLPNIKNYPDERVEVIVHKPVGYITVFSFAKEKSVWDMNKWVCRGYYKVPKISQN